MFIPNTEQFNYPEDTAGHYAPVNEIHNIIFDKNYPYVDYSKGFAFKRFWVKVLLTLIVFPMAKIKMGIRIYGKNNLKKYKKVLSKGAVSVSNHVNNWDYICVMKALHHIRFPYLLSIKENINGDSGPLVRLVGGIPIPVNDKEAIVVFNKAINKLIQEGNILQIYPEGSMWEFYSPIRPFKKGAASIAIKNNVPIIPMAFTYRKPGWLRRKLFKQIALFDLHIGEPLFANKDLEKAAQVNDLTIRMHNAVCSLAGQSDINKYSPIYNNSKRID